MLGFNSDFKESVRVSKEVSCNALSPTVPPVDVSLIKKEPTEVPPVDVSLIKKEPTEVPPIVFLLVPPKELSKLFAGNGPPVKVENT